MRSKGVIGIKVGSRLLTGEEGANRRFIAKLCQQIVILVSMGYRVFLVSSGAVLSDPTARRRKSLRASIGWRRLTGIYGEHLDRMGIDVAPICLTDRDFKARDILATFRAALKSPKVVMALNANDPVDGKELRQLKICADNDRLFKRVCLTIGQVDLAVIVFDQPGIWRPDGELVRRVAPQDVNRVLSYASGGRKPRGKERMQTKISALAALAAAGIPGVLVSGIEDNFILRAVIREPDFGTTFLCR